MLILLLPQPARAVDEAEVDRLFEQLARPEQPGWRQIEDSILLEWSKSGSPAMDLLYQRGQEAMADGNMMAAIDHFSALTDHAPGFAEGWNGRATAFFHAGELGMSVADIERTLALNPRHFGAMSGLAVIFEELGYEPEALEVYRAILAIHPHRPEVLEAIDRLQKTVEGEAL
ncbi:tetratricopeptide repeat protein [Aliiruegeria haliotis]|uniref:tetratricopeptide repeat protein n=1 Tax=Aliiruegeria haliotis TaxID=1280846 RepID=UPI001FE749D7|nr:tetratricopeptide repeat protein [Aliiruegeria haliotis]